MSYVYPVMSYVCPVISHICPVISYIWPVPEILPVIRLLSKTKLRLAGISPSMSSSRINAHTIVSLIHLYPPKGDAEHVQ